MGTLRAYLGAFARAYTYDLRRNALLWFGMLWGVPVPIFAIALDLGLGGGGRTVLDAIREHPVHLLFLAHPLMFGLVFGAAGTVYRDQEWKTLQLVAELRTLAITDPLTGVYNRRHAMEEMQNMLHRARRSMTHIGVALFDVDDFKIINESKGHLEGDRVLREIAQALRATVRQGDILARYGGDEFLLVVEGEPLGTNALVERAQAAVRERTGVGISAGVAWWPENGPTVDALLDAADRKLRSTKRETKMIVRKALDKVTP